MYIYFDVALQFRDRLLGGVPKNPDVMKVWIEQRTGLTGDSAEAILTRTKADMGADGLTGEEIDELAKMQWTGFRGDETGIYLSDYNIVAMLKEAASILKGSVGIYKFKSFVAERVTCIPARIYIGTEPAGTVESVKHLTDMRGNPVSALGRADYVERPLVEFRLKVLNDAIPVKADGKARASHVGPEEYIPWLLECGEEEGLGKDRAMQNGKFNVVRFGVVKG